MNVDVRPNGVGSPVNPWRLKLTFRGVRGSVPTPQAGHLGYGGNTTCLELLLPTGERFIFDAGTGVRELGRDLTGAVNLFFTHFHWDHIQGLPAFAPLFEPGRVLRFHASRYTAPLREALSSQMAWPHFPVDFNCLPSQCEFIDLGADAFQSGSLTVQPFPLRHPQGACGYRIESRGAVIVFATDHEHGDPNIDRGLLELCEAADLLIHDAQYTPEEQHGRYRGRGHSTWQDAVEVARQAKVRQLALFHHDPDRDDEAVSRIVASARAWFENTEGAREGWMVTL